jgi:hypothetical protein
MTGAAFTKFGLAPSTWVMEPGRGVAPEDACRGAWEGVSRIDILVVVFPFAWSRY